MAPSFSPKAFLAELNSENLAERPPTRCSESDPKPRVEWQTRPAETPRGAESHNQCDIHQTALPVRRELRKNDRPIQDGGSSPPGAVE